LSSIELNFELMRKKKK